MFPLFLTNRNSVCFSDFLVALPKTAFCLAKGCLLPGERLCPALPKVMFCVAGGKKRRFYRCFSLWRFLFCAFLLSKFLNSALYVYSSFLYMYVPCSVLLHADVCRCGCLSFHTVSGRGAAPLRAACRRTMFKMSFLTFFLLFGGQIAACVLRNCVFSDFFL